MKIPISLPIIDKDEERIVIEVLKSGWIMQGPKVEELEREIARYIGIKHAIAVSSGTAALHLSLLALGIKQGDEVIVPSFSFIATANCALYVGATPVFAEIDPKTYNIDPRDIERKITKRTKAVIAAHQIGLPAEIDAIKAICKKNNLFFVEDAACALGSTYKAKKVGGLSNIGCFSFHPRKSITTGEGGMITTNDDTLADNARRLRSHGCVKKDGKELYTDLGYNYRMSDIHAAIGLTQFKKLEIILQKRRSLATKYNDAFSSNSYIQTPFVPSHMTHTYQSYMIRILKNKKSRDDIAEKLNKKGITTKNGIMLSHLEPLYKNVLGNNIHLPVTEEVGNDSLLLPLYSQMSEEEQTYVINSLQKIISK